MNWVPVYLLFEFDCRDDGWNIFIFFIARARTAAANSMTRLALLKYYTVLFYKRDPIKHSPFVYLYGIHTTSCTFKTIAGFLINTLFFVYSCRAAKNGIRFKYLGCLIIAVDGRGGRSTGLHTQTVFPFFFSFKSNLPTKNYEQKKKTKSKMNSNC